MNIRLKKPNKWYQIIGWEININFVIPQKWNDLTDWQLQRVGKFMFDHRLEVTERTFMTNAMIVILLIPAPTIRNICKAVVLLLRVPFSELEEHAAFMFDKTKHLTSFPKFIKVGKWPFRKKMYGPANRMANCTISELSYCDAFYYKWIAEGNANDLHRLAAILYRPKPNGQHRPNPEDKRRKFSSLRLEENAALTDYIPLSLKYMVAKAYEGCRENFISKHPNVFPRKKAAEGEDQEKDKKAKPYQPLSKIIDSMAMDEVQVFGKYQDTENVYAPKFLAVYEESIKRQKARERDLKFRK